MNSPCVYIITDRTNSHLYTGVTKDVARQVLKHKCNLIDGVSSGLSLDKLVWYQPSFDMSVAIDVDAHFKTGSRDSILKLIRIRNPQWRNLYRDVLD